MNYPDIYFIIASISTIAVAGLLVFSLMYILSILADIKKLSKIARKEAEIIAKGFEKGVSAIGNELSSEAAGFVRTLFALLLSWFPAGKNRRTRKSKIKTI